MSHLQAYDVATSVVTQIFKLYLAIFFWHVLLKFAWPSEWQELLINCDIFAGVEKEGKVMPPHFPQQPDGGELVLPLMSWSLQLVIKVQSSADRMKALEGHGGSGNHTAAAIIPQAVCGLAFGSVDSGQNQEPNVGTEIYGVHIGPVIVQCSWRLVILTNRSITRAVKNKANADSALCTLTMV